MAPKSKKSQTRLTFEPVGISPSSPVSTYSPAKVRFSKAAQSRPSRHPSSSMATSSSSNQNIRHLRPKTARQGKIDGSIAPPPTRFMPKLSGRDKSATIEDSSDDSAAEIGDGGRDEEDIDLLPPTQKADNMETLHTSDSGHTDEELSTRNPRSSQSVSTRLKRTVIDDDDDYDEGDVEPPTIPTSSRKRLHSAIINLDDSDDDFPIILKSARKSSLQAHVEIHDSDEDLIFSTKERNRVPQSSPTMSTHNRTPGRLKRPRVSASSPIKSTRKGHRSEKQKKIELLRRRRAGEKIDRLTSSESSSDEDGKRGIYDSDSQDEFEVLKQFDDEEKEDEKEQNDEERSTVRKDKRKDKHRREKGVNQDSGDSDLDDFVTDDDDAPLGAPVDIPLEFTLQAHKPLKEQFPHVIEWLVHNRINPAFERRDPVYTNAWRKLDDEVSGLANSKFTSSAWKTDFARALRSRPRLEAFELSSIGSDRLYDTCEACGRSGHPSTFKIVFSGSPYHKDTLAEIESESDSDDSDDNGSDTASVDTQGMPLPPTTQEWCVGAVCCSNAETAHSLIHWRHALKEWVEERLEDEKWMTAQKLREREKMKAKRRRVLANNIVDGWQENGIVNALYADFKNNLENARNKTTTGRSMRGRFR
ncbi:hypothetical protein F5Y19DRAFT_476164 [Xylariaceae sp. FL1651]|nr:hypothetical protein F5Y19DRAFT_476164 [Xylariaceae sp. FL1651]